MSVKHNSAHAVSPCIISQAWKRFACQLYPTNYNTNTKASFDINTHARCTHHTACAQHLTDDKYRRTYGVTELMSSLENVLIHFKPKNPFAFLRSLMEYPTDNTVTSSTHTYTHTHAHAFKTHKQTQTCRKDTRILVIVCVMFVMFV